MHLLNKKFICIISENFNGKLKWHRKLRTIQELEIKNISFITAFILNVIFIVLGFFIKKVSKISSDKLEMVSWGENDKNNLNENKVEQVNKCLIGFF